jgi:hypothetical protein
MRIFLVSGFLALLLTPALRADHACSQTDLLAAAQRAKAVQSQLLAYKIQDEIDAQVPVLLQAQIRAFKKSLAALADTALQCAPEDANPKLIETTLAKLLDANKPVINEVYDPKKPPQLDHIYGDGINVKVTAPPNMPKIRLVKISFDIACGDDSLLLVYEKRGNSWSKAILWQSPEYDLVSGAFGDFFQYQVLPQKNTADWLLVAGHGYPWCSSRMSAFDVDVIQPAHDKTPQQLLFHKHGYYSRFSVPVTIKAEPGGFELRLESDMIDMDIMTRINIYRYRVSASEFQRVQPIALNGRDFVDEWLQSEWSESKNWSLSSELTELETMHEKIKKLRDYNPNDKETPNLTYGPVRPCSESPSHFQVELDEGWWVEQQKDWRPDKPTYFQIQEGKNSFTMHSASGKPDPHCTGHDIMAPH